MKAHSSLDSKRLHLRHWQESDFDHYADYYAEAATSQYVGGPCDRVHAWRRFASEIGHWTLRGYGFYLVEEKESGQFVGSVGLWFPEGWPEIELGYWLHPGAQGRGYATEAGLRVRQHAYEDLGLTTLISTIHPDNVASKKVAERLGARFEAAIDLAQFGPHEVFRHPSA
ncbi:MAG: GNAT family N-acetyltransferase [Planctomycetota bacterium]